MILFWTLVQLACLNIALGSRHAPGDFEAVSKDRYYIDKTVLIVRFFHFVEERKCQIITCPAGFIKSTNLDMIKRFVQIDVDEKGVAKAKNDTRNFRLFNDPKFLVRKYNLIYETHLAEYPVVHLELSDIVGPSVPEILIKLSTKIRKAYQEYHWLYKLYSEKYPAGYDPAGNAKERAQLNFMQNIFQPNELKAADIKQSVYQLVEILYTYFNKEVIVLIDDFDAPLIDTATNKEHHLALNMVKNIVDEVIGNLFKADMDKYIKYMLVLGTNLVPLTEENNNIVFRPFLGNHPFAYHFAFTKEELSAKLQALDYPPLTFREVNAQRGGYQLKELRQIMCRPDSIQRFFKNQTNDIPPNSWIDSGSLNALSMFLNNTEIRTKVGELLNLGNVTFKVIRPLEVAHYQKLSEIIRGLADVDSFDVDAFFTILLENGYLAYIENTKLFYGYFAQKEKILRFKIPNEEVQQVFKVYYSLYKE
ncbi:uncharacterized protein LOC135842784 [Planococcus citri]|uniref:uncharacterized protein LOC135842784 n=1 Tax=Planococcus citri TaxID=170843 RepID=UPI0031FA068C